MKEVEQQKFILSETNEILSKKSKDLEESVKKLQETHKEQSQKSRELEQEKILLKEISKSEQKRERYIHKKFYVLIVLIIVSVSTGFISYSQYENHVLIDTASRVMTNYNSNYVIQDLKGDTVNTWVAWNIQDGRVLHVSIVNTANLSQDKIDAIKDAILSTKTVTLDDSLLHKGPPGTSSVYYTGWEGALTDAYSQPTTSYIPQKFDVSGSSNGPGDIVIILTNDVNPDGLSGFTKSIADGNEILKSKITIYSASELSLGQLGAITRHEFGHAMGLAHSTAPEDLMHATIQTDYPYISGCDIDAIKGLYDGKKKSEVVCQK